MLSDSLSEARATLMWAYRHYCMGPEFEGTYDGDMKSRVRSVITEMTRLQFQPGMDLIPQDADGNPMPTIDIEAWDPTREQQCYPKPPE